MRTVVHFREANIYGSPERLILGQVKYGKLFHHVPVTFRKRKMANPFALEMERQGNSFEEVVEHFTGDFSTVRRIADVIRHLDASLVVSHDFKSDLYCKWTSVRARRPHVIYHHGFTNENARVRLYNRIDRAVMKRAKAVITVAEQTKERLASLGIRSAKVFVVVNAVDESAFELVDYVPPPFSQPGPLIVSVGRLSYEKGFDLLVNACVILRQKGKPFNLLILGDGPERPEIERLIEHHQLSGQIQLAGFCKDVRGAYGASSFVVMPSRSEGFPLVLLEAWAQGAPVVATPAGGLQSLVRTGENGILAAGIDVESIASSMTKALADPDFRDKYGPAARQTVKDNYLFKHQICQLESLYETLIEDQLSAL